MRLIKWRTVAIIVLVVIIVLGVLLVDRDRVGPAIAGFRAGYTQGYKALQTAEDEAVSGFDRARAEIKPVKGLEAQREALSRLGFSATIRDCK